MCVRARRKERCISFDSYIKPQLTYYLSCQDKVVYLLIPTSNHNSHLCFRSLHGVVYLLIPTSNHNWRCKNNNMVQLYIFWFLHQTTTWRLRVPLRVRCISFDSYIKPQHTWEFTLKSSVVYLLIPTSNHNPTSQRNACEQVVYLLIPTSNHNSALHLLAYQLLYIFWFLHQTTTFRLPVFIQSGCISFDSYIKPQPGRLRMSARGSCISFDSYIKPQPGLCRRSSTPCCISFDSYIKPQQWYDHIARCQGCISFDSYIKPQLDSTITLSVMVVYLLIPTSNHNQRDQRLC